MAIRFDGGGSGRRTGSGSGAGPGARAGDGRGRGRPRGRWRSDAVPGAAPGDARATAERDQKDARGGARRSRSAIRRWRAFDQAYSQMDAGRWDRAVEAFARVAAMKGTRADGALYWKAYSQDRLGQRAEALATIAELAKTYPASRYVKQAQALEMEVRRNVGQPVQPGGAGRRGAEADRGQRLLNSDPEKALPMLEKLLQGPASPQRARARGVRPGAEQLAARPRDPEEPRARRRRRRSCRARRSSTSA